MAFQSVPKCASAFFQCTFQGEPVGFTMYFFRAAGYVQTDIDNLADVMDSWMATEFLPELSIDLVYNGVEIRGLEFEEDLTAFDGDGTGPGSITGNSTPGNVSFALKRLSGFTGRSARGRIFVPGIANQDLGVADENFVSSVRVANWVTALLEVLAYAITHGWIDVIVSRWNDGMKRTEGVVFGISTWTNSDLRVDTQRRRLPTA